MENLANLLHIWHDDTIRMEIEIAHFIWCNQNLIPVLWVYVCSSSECVYVQCETAYQTFHCLLHTFHETSTKCTEAPNQQNLNCRQINLNLIEFQFQPKTFGFLNSRILVSHTLAYFDSQRIFATFLNQMNFKSRWNIAWASNVFAL